jgi:hypothetical protein
MVFSQVWRAFMSTRRDSGKPERFGEPSYEQRTRSAGGVLTPKQAPQRPGTAPALGLRAGMVAVAIISQTACFKEQLS